MVWFWFLFAIPISFSLLGTEVKYRRKYFSWFVIFFIFSLVIGYRYEVGGDWNNYLEHFNFYRRFSILDVVSASDPGYVFTNWLASQWGWQIYGVNLVCGALFMAGLLVFCRQQERPWLSLTVAVPYIVIVIAMGYTLQSVALGLLFWALACLERGEFRRYLGLMIVAALFHRTALLMVPLGLFLERRGWLVRLVALLISGYVLWDLLLAEQQAALWKNYVEAQMESSGAMIRVVMNLVPALLFFIYRNSWKERYPNYRFWYVLAVGSVVSVFLVGYASTAVDRVALYFTPIQVAVFSRLPTLARRQLAPRVMKICIILGYGLVLLVWLNFATHAQYWVPYRNWLFL